MASWSKLNRWWLMIVDDRRWTMTRWGWLMKMNEGWWLMTVEDGRWCWWWLINGDDGRWWWTGWREVAAKKMGFGGLIVLVGLRAWVVVSHYLTYSQSYMILSLFHLIIHITFHYLESLLWVISYIFLQWWTSLQLSLSYIYQLNKQKWEELSGKIKQVGDSVKI